MPNDYSRMKPLFSAPSSDRGVASRRDREGSASVFLWTLSGLVIASCGGSSGSSLAPGFEVQLGGFSDDADIYRAGIEGTEGAVLGTTQNGVVRVSNEHANAELVAQVSGEDYAPLPGDTGADTDGRVSITPLTDLVAQAISGDSPPTAQEVLNGIFGTIVSGSGSTLSVANIVSVADIRDMSNYGGASPDLAGRLISRASEAVEALRADDTRDTHEGAYSEYVDIQGIRIWREDGTGIGTLELRHHASADSVVTEVADGAHRLDIDELSTLTRDAIIRKINSATEFEDYAAEYVGDPEAQSISETITLTSGSTEAIAAADSSEEVTKLTYLLEYARAQNTDATAEDTARMNYGRLRNEVRRELEIEIDEVLTAALEETSLAEAEDEDDPDIFAVSGSFEYGRLSNAGDPGDYPPTIWVSKARTGFNENTPRLADNALDNVDPETTLANGETTDTEYGIFSFSSNDQIGELTWTYTLGGSDLLNGAIEALSAGEVITERVWVIVHTGGEVSDAPTLNLRMIEVTITGVNDAPTHNDEHTSWQAVADGITYNTESGVLGDTNTFSIGDAFNDADVNDELRFSYSISYTDTENTLTTAEDGTVSWLSLDAETGEFTIDHTNADIAIGGYTVEVTADDGSGAEDSSVSAEFELDIVTGIVISQGGTYYLSQYLEGRFRDDPFSSFEAGPGAPTGVTVHADGRIVVEATVDATEDGGSPLMVPISLTFNDETRVQNIAITVSDESRGALPSITTSTSDLLGEVLAPTQGEFANPTDSRTAANFADSQIMIEAQDEGVLGNSIRFEINTQGLPSDTVQSVRFGTEEFHSTGEIVFTLTVGPDTTLTAIINAINTHNGRTGEPSASDLVEASLVENVEGTDSWGRSDGDPTVVMQLAGGTNDFTDAGIITVGQNGVDEDELFVVVSNPAQVFAENAPLSTLLEYPTVVSADGGSAPTQYGVISFSIDDDNDMITWTYSLAAADELLEKPHPTVVALAADDTLTDTFRVNLMDEHGGFTATANREFSVTITGVDDIAVEEANRGGLATDPVVRVAEGGYYVLNSQIDENENKIDDIRYNDPDTGQDNVSYIVSSVTGGTLREWVGAGQGDRENRDLWDEISGSDIFTQDDIDAGDIAFFHSDSTNDLSVVNFEYSVLIGDDYVDDATSVAIADKAFHLGVDVTPPLLNGDVKFAFVGGDIHQGAFVFAYNSATSSHDSARIYADTSASTDYKISVPPSGNGNVNLRAAWNSSSSDTDSFRGILEEWDSTSDTGYLREGVYLRLRDPDALDSGFFGVNDGLSEASLVPFETADTYVSKGGLVDVEAYGVMLFNEKAVDLSSLVLRVGDNQRISTQIVEDQEDPTPTEKAQAYFDTVSYPEVDDVNLLASGDGIQDYLGSHGTFHVSRQGGVLLWEYEFTDVNNPLLQNDTEDHLWIQVIENRGSPIDTRYEGEDIFEIAVTIDVI